MNSRRPLILLVLLALSARIASASSGNSAFQSDNLTVLDRHTGNTITVSNRFDGNNHFIEIISFNQNRGTNWGPLAHYDGYPEHAAAISLDEDGNIYIAGSRLVNEVQVFWVMKYSAQGTYNWEWQDTGFGGAQGCRATRIVTNAQGDSWVAGSCRNGNQIPLRLVRVNGNGAILWPQMYYGATRNYIRDLSVDVGDRVSVSVEISDGNSGDNWITRTLVYNKDGDQITVY